MPQIFQPLRTAWRYVARCFEVKAARGDSAFAVIVFHGICSEILLKHLSWTYAQRYEI